MGFSTQAKQYSPNGNVCTRKVVNVFNSLATINGNNILSHFRSWQRSRRVRSLNKNPNYIVDQLTPMNNLCYQSMSPNTAGVKSLSELNFYKSTSDLLSNKDTSAPVVSFRNKGEGMIAMQLTDRVMLNENQLYSLNISSSPKLKSNDKLKKAACAAKANCYMTLDHREKDDTSGLYNSTLANEPWFYGSIERERAIQLVQNCSIGSFVVRNSSTKSRCFALTVRVPNDYNGIGIAHYLILQAETGMLKIKGFQKEFCTVSSLITHHSIMKEQLPCTLLLDHRNLYKSVSCTQLRYHNNNNNNNSNNNDKCASLYLPHSTQSSTNNIYNTYGKSYNSIQAAVCEQEDLMVDIDTDPTYQKILDNFRKAMAHCS